MSDRAARLKRRVKRAIARRRRSRLGRSIGSLGLSLWTAYENDDSDLYANGESGVLDALRGAELRCAVDVGAFHGEWTAALLDRFPSATVHCFEISKVNHDKLAQRFGDDDRVVLNAVGVGAAEGRTEIYYRCGHPDMTSTIATTGDEEHARADLTTLDRYAVDRSLERIDYLKVDVEGGELDILQGARTLLDRGCIGAIQFEFNLWSVMSRTWLHDFYDALEPKGFAIGKIYPGYVDFRAYSPRHEVFVRANFLAVHRARRDLMAPLGAG